MDSNNLTPLRKGIVGVQFLFVAFGATVLVPLLVGLDPPLLYLPPGSVLLSFTLSLVGRFLFSWEVVLLLLLLS